MQDKIFEALTRTRILRRWLNYDRWDDVGVTRRLSGGKVDLLANLALFLF